MRISYENTDDVVLSALGERLSRSRLARNLSQAQLAAEAGVSKRTVERLEAGEATQLSGFIRVLRALGLFDRLDDLVPEPLPSPIEQMKLRGRQRQRATSARASRQADSQPGPWTWGDAQGSGDA